MPPNSKKLLILMSIAMPLAFSVWAALLNNYAVEMASFSGAQIGLLQSIREIPGFLAFTAVLVLLLVREQPFAMFSLALLGAGVAMTGFFPSALGLYLTTFLMSVGFHYFETLKQSLSLQWLSKEQAPAVLGQLISVGALTSLCVYAALWLLLEIVQLDYLWVYVIAGASAMGLAFYMQLAFPIFTATTPQHKHLILRRRYWLFYALTFMSGARRQIFMVFASFLMVQKFGYSAADIALLYLVNHLVSWLSASRIGAWIGRVGERRALTFEYIGLIVLFIAYAVVRDSQVAAVLYVIDHLLFAMAIAIKTYFQKIADPADIAGTVSVSFSINHIAAVVIPALFGLLWLRSPAAVFLLGAAMAAISLLLAQLVPARPLPGRETLLIREPRLTE